MNVRKTRFPELGYTQLSTDLWRIVSTDGNQCVGPEYRTKAELLADLSRYATDYGCNPAYGQQTTAASSEQPTEQVLAPATKAQLLADVLLRFACEQDEQTANSLQHIIDRLTAVYSHYEIAAAIAQSYEHIATLTFPDPEMPVVYRKRAEQFRNLARNEKEQHNAWDINKQPVPLWIYSLDFIVRTSDASFFHIPNSFQREITNGCSCDTCKSGASRPTWNVLAVPFIKNPTKAGQNTHTWTVHVGNIPEFVQYCEQVRKRAERPTASSEQQTT